MADFQNISKVNTNLFFKGMNKDFSPEFLQEGTYVHARNTVNNSDKGDLLKVGNEPSNLECANFPYTYIGNIPLINDRYLIFSTNDNDSEIGILDETKCTYTTLINDSLQLSKLGFKTTNLIKGESKENPDCTETAYWNDGINPARSVNINTIPYVTKFKTDPTGGCDIEEVTSEVDLQKLRMTPLLSIPTLTIKRGDSGGNLPNGTYRVALGYANDLERLTDFLTISTPVFLFNQTFPTGSLEVTVTGSDTNFKNYVLVLIRTVNQQTKATLLGTYPVEQKTVYVDSFSETDEVIDLQRIPLQSVHYEGGDAIFRAGEYLIQSGPRTRPQFNYQPQASKITSKWVGYAVPENYYRRGGTKIGYTKGEVISLFIRFVYDTGHRTSSWPIIGREASTDEKSLVNNRDSKAYGDGENVEKWEIYDTSTILKTYPASFDEEYPMYEGELGYYETEDIYPDNKEVWGNLACKPTRHGRFPDNSTVPNYDSVKNKLIILGLKFENISYPLGEDKKPIKGIVGYEILRGDKEGNKSIVAKGLIYNTGEYELPISYNNNVKALYANYPFNDLRTDPFLSKKFPNGGCAGSGYQPVGTFNRQLFTFHSPETSFTNPALASYMKVEAEYIGKAQGFFEPVYGHPRHKLIRDFSLIVAATVGIGEGLLAIKGTTTKTYRAPDGENKGEVATGGAVAQVAGSAVASGWQAGYSAADAILRNSAVTSIISDTVKPFLEQAGILLGVTPGARGGSYTYTTSDTAYKNVPLFLKIGTNVVLFSYFFGQGTSMALNIIKTLVPYRQHAYQCNMEGQYTKQIGPKRDNTLRKIEDYTYLYSGYQSFQGYRVNNNLRESSVLLKLNESISDTNTKDNSRTTIGNNKQWENPEKPFERDIAAYYVSIKKKLKNVYSQLESIRIVPTTNEIFPISETDTKAESGFIFGGDTIIEEFTLKRKNNLFTQTQADGNLQNPSGYEFDYKNYPNMLYPRYWMDTQEYDLTQLFNLSNIRLPNDSYYLDRDPAKCRRKIGFSVNQGYMYTSVNGIVRFYVESSYNLPFRKNMLTEPEKKHYDKEISTDLSELFRSDVIRKDNYYEIDKSLSPIKQLNLTYSEILPRDFSVKLNKCYTYEPNKIIYSLPSNLEQRTDNWSTFLTNNFFLFPKADGKLVAIRSINRTGILYFFSSAPLKMHTGVDELQTDANLKVILGDGGLFARQPQSLTNTDNDFTECQSSEGIVSTQYGVFFISQKQGKIFNYAGQVRDISAPIKWWLAEYLPSRILRDFPDFELPDNPSVGVGCMATFDNTNEIVYFSKRDYAVKPDFKSRITYWKANEFKLDGRTTILLGDPTFFDDASWTLSYDPKGEGAYISYHDWHPQGIIQTDNHFATIKDSTIWKHNEAKDSFCTFYGVEFPWEIAYPFTNIQEVTTLETIEYQLEAYKYFNEGKDRHHILYDNFDRAVIYNTEQCSGNLKLNLRKWNDPTQILMYPQYTSNGVNVEVTKQENIYRLNQFKDLTKNRGQFTLNWRTIFNTQENGYISVLNPNNIDYNKEPQERKKFRHRINIVLLKKIISENTKFLLTLINNKSIKSFR